VRGVYATKVSGQLPDEIVAAIEDEGRIRYIPYDTSLHCERGVVD
jgi:transcription elongation factor SPT4